jgi:hypothetical protein
MMALQLFSFEVNCTRSVELYNGFQGSPVDMVPVLRDLLLPDQNISDDFLSSQLLSDSFIKEASNRIGETCNNILCSSLHFTGNADIAGIGVCPLFSLSCLFRVRVVADRFKALVAYTTIVLLSITFFLIGYRFDARHSRTAYDVLADNYFQSIMYFGMSVQIAFWAYLPSMETLYELTLGMYCLHSSLAHQTLTIT